MRLVVFSIIAAFFASVHPYSFCPKCIHHYTTQRVNPTKPNCNLFHNNTLFRDLIDVDFLGKEICTTKGKYFISKEKEHIDDEEYIVAS